MYRNLDNTNSSQITTRSRLLNRTSLSKFLAAVNTYNFSDVLDNDDVDSAFLRFDNVILSLYNIHCPIVLKTKSYKELCKPWIDGETRNYIKMRDDYLKLVRLGRMNRLTFNRLRNSITKMIRIKKKTYLDNKFHELRNDLKRTWSLINELIGGGSGGGGRRGLEKLLMVTNS